MIYDVAVVGAGINGCASAYELHNASQNVILFDKDGVASGGSGAAGAFISPKFSKAGELKELLNKAFIYSLNFYKQFGRAFSQTQLIHIAKDENDAKNLKYFKDNTSFSLLDIPNELNIQEEAISLNTGLVDAKEMCILLTKNIDFKKEEISKLDHIDGVWLINNKFKAKKVILAIGAYKKIINEPYIQLRGVWGHRIDVRTSIQQPYSLHQYLSISHKTDGKLAIGATHNVHYHPQFSKEKYNLEDGRKVLLENASKMIDLKNIEIIKDYTGLRSGSFDYLPLVGKIVDAKKTLEDDTIRFKVKKADFSQYHYYNDLYIINGSGGYGFVLAPYLAKILKDNIVYKKPIERLLQPARFFARYAKKHAKK